MDVKNMRIYVGRKLDIRQVQNKYKYRTGVGAKIFHARIQTTVQDEDHNDVLCVHM